MIADRIGRALAGTLLMTVILVGFFAVYPSAELWAGFEPADCPEYCEHSNRCGPLETRGSVQQPLNSWSNLAFVFAGLLVVAHGATPMRLLVGASCLVLGLGSFLFHASMMRAFQWLDVVGMLVVMSALLAWSVHRVFRVRARWLLPSVLVADVLFARFKWQIPTREAMVAIGLGVVVAAVAAVRDGRQRGWLLLVPLVCIGAGYGVRELDVNRTLCWPESLWFQGHAVWHLLSAASIYGSWWCFEHLDLPTGRRD